MFFIFWGGGVVFILGSCHTLCEQSQLSLVQDDNIN